MRFGRPVPVCVTWIVLIVAISCLNFVNGSNALANGRTVQLSAGHVPVVRVARGKTETIDVGRRFDEIVIGNPEVATLTPLTDHSFYVLGHRLGTTGIAFFDENRSLIGSLDVEVTLDTAQLERTIRQNVSQSNIRVTSANGRLILSGTVADAMSAEQARQIAEQFADGEDIVNSISITTSQQVQLNVRFVEINRAVGAELGSRIDAVYNAGGGSISFNSRPTSSSNSPAGSIVGQLVSGGLSIDLAISALEERGLARRLAEPNLVARSGESASFLAGGEFPIPVSEENGRVTVSYKRFGVALDFTPTVLSDGLISLDVEPEVSAIDQTASYRVGAIAIPGFVVRRARTSVDLRSGQSFMIAGLLQSQVDVNSTGIPGLSRLPVLGALFSSRSYQKRETDLVVIVTPHLIQPVGPTLKVAVPTDGLAEPQPYDLILGAQSGANPPAHRSSTSQQQVSSGGHFLELR